MLKIFADLGYKCWFKRKCMHQYFIKLHVDNVPCGIVVNEHVHGFGVFDEKYRFVKSSSQIRGNNGQFVPNFNKKDIPYIDEDVIFIGNVFPQFGHFLLEHMNRAYALLDDKYKNKKVVLINNKDINPVPGYMFDFLELLGVKHDDIIILNETTQFRNVYIPMQAYNLPIYSAHEFGETFARIAENVKSMPVKFEKIYVSRCALENRRTRGEEKIQHIFEKNGFKIIYPETMNLSDQISFIKDCKILAGCAGTALHLALFMKPGGTVIQIKRNRINKDNAPTQYLINKVKMLNSVFVSGSIEIEKTDHGSVAPQIIGMTKYMKQFFDTYNFKYTVSDLEKDIEAWNDYKNSITEYKQKNGEFITIWLKRKLVRYSACLIPGRERRGNYRRWLKSKLKYEG